MKNQNKARVNDLCEKLDMDFNEAVEILSSETLDGMKMASICGAGDYWHHYDREYSCCGINAYADGGVDTGSGLVGYSNLLVSFNDKWMFNGYFVKDVEVDGGTFTYSHLGSSDPDFCVPTDVTDILWHRITGRLGNCCC